MRLREEEVHEFASLKLEFRAICPWYWVIDAPPLFDGADHAVRHPSLVTLLTEGRPGADGATAGMLIDVENDGVSPCRTFVARPPIVTLPPREPVTEPPRPSDTTPPDVDTPTEHVPDKRPVRVRVMSLWMLNADSNKYWSTVTRVPDRDQSMPRR